MLLVMPQDIQAPKGRLILPQVQTIRDLLDHRCLVMSCTTDKLDEALSALKQPPKWIITDSQVFKTVYDKKPKESRLTSFSVLFANYKGDLSEFVQGAAAIESLTEHSKVLIAEACTHAPLSEDIGREKLPRMLRNKVGQGLAVDVVGGPAFPEDLSGYDLIIHCGAACLTAAMSCPVLTGLKAKACLLPITAWPSPSSLVFWIKSICRLSLKTKSVGRISKKLILPTLFACFHQKAYGNGKIGDLTLFLLFDDKPPDDYSILLKRIFKNSKPRGATAAGPACLMVHKVGTGQQQLGNRYNLISLSLDSRYRGGQGLNRGLCAVVQKDDGAWLQLGREPVFHVFRRRILPVVAVNIPLDTVHSQVIGGFHHRIIVIAVGARNKIGLSPVISLIFSLHPVISASCCSFPT